MPNNYNFLDAASSVLTARSSITSGSVHEPIITISSVLSPVPVVFSGSPSISGAVTIVGIPQASVHGIISVQSTIGIGNTPSISGTVNIGNIPQASVHGVVQITGNPSISGTVNIGNIPQASVHGQVGASLIGQLPEGTRVLGSVMTLQGTNPWITTGSVSGTVGASIIGLPPVRISDGTNNLQVYEENNIDTSVVGLVTLFRSNPNTSVLSVISPTTPLPTIGSVSGTIGASIVGQLPSGTAMLGSVAAMQGNAIWNIAGSVAGTVGASIIGAVPVFGTTAEDSGHSSGDRGHFILGVRNDAVASFV